MLLASGNIVETIRRIVTVDVELTPCKVLVITTILEQLVNKHKNALTELGKTTVNDSFINMHLNNFRWAGIEVRKNKQNCLFDFFISAIVPTLLHHGIEFQFNIDISMECSNCKEVMKINHQTWDYLFISQTSSGDILENIVADLFGRTLQKNICPRCFDDNEHYCSLSLMNCPKNLFVRFDPNINTGNKRHMLKTHVNFSNIISNNIIFTSSYTCYTLQSFVVFYGKDDKGHYVTFAQKKGEWYRLNDNNITVVQSSSLFGDQADSQPILLAHFIRPSDADVFSIALWNVFSNFSPINVTLEPSLSLNDAVIRFGKYNIIKNNPLNLVVIKFFKCSNCHASMFG